MGIDLPRDIGTRRLPWSRLARIIEYAPNDSALARARRGHKPDLDILFARRMEHWLHLLFWTKTKDGAKGRERPVPVPLAGDAKNRGRDTLALDEKLARRQEARRAELAAMQDPQPQED